MKEILNPEVEKEILSIQANIRRAEFNVRKAIDERRVREAKMQIVTDYEKPKQDEPDYFYFWTLGIGFILGVWVTILVRAAL